MSTYYKFKCPGCGEQGGFFSRQAWGWGNADLIETFRFVFWHVRECGARSLEILDEHGLDYLDETARRDLAPGNRDFPFSDDWDWVAEIPDDTDISAGERWDRDVAPKIRENGEV